MQKPPTITLKIISLETNKSQAIVLDADLIDTYLVGRNPACKIVLDDPLVSNVHGQFSQKDNKWYYMDLLPTNSSSFNNSDIPNNYIHLKIRDSICIGNSLLLIDDINVTAKESSNKIFAGASPWKNHLWTQDKLTVRCVGIIEETPAVKTFRFVAANSPVQFDYKAGQFITLSLNINGQPVYRSYTISSSPSRPQILEITVKRVIPLSDVLDAPPGLVSNWLHDNLNVGSELQISHPMGNFSCLGHPAKKVLFVSAGSGITPMMSMSRWAYDVAADLDIVFFHSTRSSRDLIYHRELAWMSHNANFHLHLSLTREEFGSYWSGLTGRLQAEMLTKIAPDFKDRIVYVCGSDGFMQGVKTLFQSLDFLMENYYQESFGSFQQPKTLLQPKTSQINKKEASSTSLILFSTSGSEIHHDGENSILELAEQHNVSIKSACRKGNCGLCKLQKIQGEVKYKDTPNALSSNEKAAGFILACIAYPIGRVEIDA
jgi:glycine betaine catabolism B